MAELDVIESADADDDFIMLTSGGFHESEWLEGEAVTLVEWR